MPKESNCFKALISDPLIVPTPCTYIDVLYVVKKAEYCEIKRDKTQMAALCLRNLLKIFYDLGSSVFDQSVSEHAFFF